MTGAIGLALSGLSGVAPRRLALLAAVAERRGFDTLALTESFSDVMPLAGAVAAETRNATITTAIANIGFRHPGLMAMGAAAVDQLSDGRFVLGLGLGTQWFDLASRPARPLAAVEEYVGIMRRLWAAGTTSTSAAGETYRLDEFRLDFRPLRPDIPIYLAALNPGMLRLAGRIADGVFLNLVPIDLIPSVIATVREAALGAGREPTAVKVALLIRAGLDDDSERARAAVRGSIPVYLMFDGYARRMREIGYGAVVDAVQQATRSGDDAAAAAAVPDELIDRLAVYGTADRCRDGLERFRTAGVDLPIVSPRAVGDAWESTIEQAIETFAPGPAHSARW